MFEIAHVGGSGLRDVLGVWVSTGNSGEVRRNRFVERSAENQRWNSNVFELVEDVPILEGSRDVIVRLANHCPERDWRVPDTESARS